MREHPTSERLNDLVDGLLEGHELRATEAHLAGCPACADQVEGLSRLLGSLERLPLEARPPRDLWPGIQSLIAADLIAAERGQAGDPAASLPGDSGRTEGGPAKVLAFPGGRAERASPLRRRLSVTVPQLAAAAAVVALVSAGSVWLTLSGGTAPMAEARDPAAGASPFVVTAATPLDAALGDLEAALTQGRGVLDPGTLAAVEESLATIDQAIREAREALAEDPGSELLNRLLINHQRAKLRVLQQATAGLIRT